MSSWFERFADKVVSPQQAVRKIERGRRILIGSGAAEPSRMVEAMVEHGDHLADNQVVHLLTLGPAPYVRPGLENRFRHIAFFIGPNVREAVQQGRADFMPVFLSEIPELIRSRRIRIDVALIQVSPPDHHGYFSLGVSVDIVSSAVAAANLVLAEVNPHMPRTLGDSFIHGSRIQHLVPVDYPLPELEVAPLDDVALEIGRHVALLVPDGATLQVGIGRVGEAVLAALGDRSHLGVHTEMLSDGMMRLAEAGVITGRKKTLLPGKMVTSFVMGTRPLYEWVHDNPMVEMRPSHFTNDPFTIARNDRMIAVNSALAVDLTGQVASDTVGGRFRSGIGGQVDFIRGAARSPGGKSIIALPSTAREGTVSRIQAVFGEGAGVVTSRGDVRYVVTEYGVADLWGKNVRERAMALIEIAHPDHRADLVAGAKERRYVFLDQVVPRGLYPWEETRGHHLPSGREVVVRPARLTDETAIQELLYALSDESTYRRFHMFKRLHHHADVQRLVDLDYEANMALAVTLPDAEGGQILGICQYFLDPATDLAEIAFVVRDEYQRQGLGKLLMRRMTEIARARGVAGFTAEALASNQPMLKVFYGSGLGFKGKLEEGVYHLTACFEPAAESSERPPAVEGSGPEPLRA